MLASAARYTGTPMTSPTNSAMAEMAAYRAEVAALRADNDRLRAALQYAKDQLFDTSDCKGCMERVCDCWAYRIRAAIDAAQGGKS